MHAAMSPSYPSDRNQWRDVAVERTESNLLMGDWQVMQDWERPLMAHMATAATSPHGDLLEVGFGMGISASMLVAGGCRSYTVIEAHPGIADHARSWAAEQSVSCHVIEGFWQDVVPSLETRYDSILFDTYPMTEKERGRNHFSFIPVAAELLQPDGVFTYYSDETIDFRSEHLRLLLGSFREVTLTTVQGLKPPPDCEYWNADHMVVPVARQPITTTRRNVRSLR